MIPNGWRQLSIGDITEQGDNFWVMTQTWATIIIGGIVITDKILAEHGPIIRRVE